MPYTHLKIRKPNGLKFNRLIVKELAKSKLTQPKFAHKLGCSLSLITQIKGGNNYVHTMPQMLMMGRALGFKKSYLYKLAGYPKIAKREAKKEAKEASNTTIDISKSPKSNLIAFGGKRFTKDQLIYAKGVMRGVLIGLQSK